jgi:hypothetical protein
VPLLQFEYLHKGTFLGAEIFGIFITHLGPHTGKISLKSVRSIEHVFCHLGRPYRAMAPRKLSNDLEDKVIFVNTLESSVVCDYFSLRKEQFLQSVALLVCVENYAIAFKDLLI